MAFQEKKSKVLARQWGAGLFLLWSVLHIYVGIAGLIEFLFGTSQSQWKMLLGGAHAPLNAFQFATDAITQNAQSHLFVNFCLDVGGYGVLGLFVAWMIWKHGSWLGYWIGLVVIGLADLSFTFAMVTPGIIRLDWASVSGPIIWFVAVLITPFGLLARGEKQREGTFGLPSPSN
ncbi:MAG: hypothetical protein U0350_10670 [Caldilineaceae bacterium]